MRKFTLFFMSMFLVLGTVVAKDEVKDFNSPEVYPNNGAKEMAVYNIRLKFPKHVTITDSEVSIDVVNTNTNEVVKITSCAVDEWDPYWAVFYFEKIEVDGKDGKEYRDQYIDKPGTYTYTIPAGLITSAEGDVFAGGTYTFSIVAPTPTFPIKDYTPKETTELKEIVVMFDEEITEVKNLGSAAVMESNMWTYMSGFNGATINEDKKSVTLTLSSPITAVGNYHLELYPGTFLSANGENAYGWLDFKVIDPTPGFTTNYNDGDRVKELGNLIITFKNVTQVEMTEGAEIIVVLPSGDEIPGEIEKQGNQFVVSFDADLTEDGDYTFIIPGGTFSMDGAASEGRVINVELFTFEILDLEVVDAYPTNGGIVDQLDRIVIKFNQIIEVSWTEDWMTQPAREIELTCGDKTYTLIYNPSSSLGDQLEYLVNAEWDGFQYAATPIYEAGTYTLDLSQIIVNYAGEFEDSPWGLIANVWHRMRQSAKGTLSWNVSGKNASVDNIPVAEGEQVIYDLLGRRVENISGAGIYIVNGRKVIIK